MKFNDIFSIDSSTGGGKRLIKNIINKYRLGNEYKEIKENIENKNVSSSSDMEYYSVNEELLFTLGEIVLNIIKDTPLIKYTYKPVNEGIEKCIGGGWNFHEVINSGGTIHFYGIGFTKIIKNNITVNNLKDFYELLGLNMTLFDSIFTPITKEEFYDLNNI